MKYKSFIFVCLLICFISMGSVVATDLNETVGSNEGQSEEVISIDNEELISEDNHIEEVSASEDSELSATTGTFADLAYEISNARNELNLTRDYKYDSIVDKGFEKGIKIYSNITINGNGFLINGSSAARVFYVISDNVTIKNINFFDCTYYENGGAIYWAGSYGSLKQCNFNNCNVKNGKNSYMADGGAIYWLGDYGNILNSNFDNCYIKHDKESYYTGTRGGAIYWFGKKGILTNCKFNQCYINSYSSSSSGTSCEGGAIHLYGDFSTVTNCSFERNYISSSGSTLASAQGGAIYISASNSLINHCFFKNNYVSGSGADRIKGGAIVSILNELDILSSYFISNKANKGSAIFSLGGKIRDSVFLSNNNEVISTQSTSDKVDANYNLWDSTSKPTVSSSVDVSKRLYLKVTVDKTSLEMGETAIIKIDFNNIVDSSAKYSYSKLADIGVTINEDGVLNKQVIHNGYGEITYTAKNIPKGNISVTIDNFNTKYSFNFNISKGGTKLISSNVNAAHNGGNYVIATLKDNYGHVIPNANVNVNLEGISSNIITDNLGQVKLNVNGLDVNTYTAILTFEGNEKYLNDSTMVKIIINNSPQPIDDKDINVPLLDDAINGAITITLPEDSTGTITLNINNLNYSFVVDGGRAEVQIPQLTNGVYPYSITYSGNNKYSSFERIGTFTVNEEFTSPQQFIDDKKITISSLDDGLGVIKLPSDAKGIITIDIAGHQYGFGVVNGVCDVDITGLSKGIYGYIIMYSGDEKYLSFLKTGYLTVNTQANQVNTNIPKNPKVTTEKIILSLKKVKIKKSAKKLVITATLKVNGKAVKGKTIKFKFNKKSYNTKTNAKGIAKITVQKSVLKKLKAGKKVKYQATYGKITKKIKVKVKK